MAYYNKTINDGPYGSFMADPNGSTIAIYTRCIFAAASAATLDGKPILQVATAAQHGEVVTMQPIAAGAYGAVKFMNAGGEQFGVMAGNCTEGDTLYAETSGKVGKATAGGAIVHGVATSPGADGGVVTYTRGNPTI